MGHTMRWVRYENLDLCTTMIHMTFQLTFNFTSRVLVRIILLSSMCIGVAFR